MCDHCGCRSFQPIAELTAEHEEILRLAWVMAEAGRAGVVPAPSVRHDLLALLDLHVAKEETGLYPSLLASGGASIGEVAGLEAEHRDLRRSFTGATFDRSDFYALAAHIETEELELFPAAMLGFDEEEWNATGDAHRTLEAGHPELAGDAGGGGSRARGPLVRVTARRFALVAKVVLLPALLATGIALAV